MQLSTIVDEMKEEIVNKRKQHKNLHSDLASYKVWKRAMFYLLGLMENVMMYFLCCLILSQTKYETRTKQYTKAREQTKTAVALFHKSRYQLPPSLIYVIVRCPIS